MSIKKDIVWRVGLVYLAVFLFALLIASKVVFLKFINDNKWKEIAREVRIKNDTIESNRGDIYSDDLRLLATSIPYYQIYIDTQVPHLTEQVFRNNIDSLAYCLSVLFRDKPASMYKREIENARRHKERYYLLKSNVNYLQLKKLKTFPIFRWGKNKGGFITESRTKRIRPQEDLARRTIGFLTMSKTDHDVGLEGAFNKYLKGKEGFQKKQKISGGEWMPIDDNDEVDPEDGSSIVATIDIDLQDVAHRALLKQLKLQGARYGTVVLMDVATGDIKAMVNLTRLGEDDYREVLNYAVGASTEPGSTFKVPAIMTALEDGIYDLNDTVNTENGRYEPYKGFDITDDSYDHGGYGTITVEQVIEKSSNVGMAKLITRAYKKDPKKFVDHLCKMSLKAPLGIDIPGEGKTQIHYPGDPLWSGVSLAQMAYGYEVALTPLHILAFYNAIANGGKMVKPRIVKEIRNHGKIEQTFAPEVINPSICSKSTLKKVHTMLEGVVERGTAVNLQASHFKIAGKTGTTQIFNEKYGYKGGKMSYQASFVGYFPASHPKYSCIVVVNAPSKSVYTGNRVAGPVFLEIANKVYATSLPLQPALNDNKDKVVEIPYSKNGYSRETITALKDLGIKTAISENVKDWVITQREDDKVVLGNKKFIDNLMPDLVTMGLKDALYIIENMGMQAEVKGRGSVRSQSIPPGSRISKGEKVILEMSFTEG